jgi:four helix bundle protein
LAIYVDLGFMSSMTERFAIFEKVPPADLFGDPIWRLPAYRIALFLSDLLPNDTSLLWRTACPRHVVDQLSRAVDSIRSNISEGYSKYSGRERARYYETALCSAREARDWYRRAIPWLGQDEAYERAALLTRVIKILLVAIPQERSGANEYRLRRKFRDGKSGSEGGTPAT